MIKMMYFEPKNIEKSYEKFQIIFHTAFLDNIYVIFAFLLFLLLIIFFCPTMPLLICQYLVLTMSSF